MLVFISIPYFLDDQLSHIELMFVVFYRYDTGGDKFIDQGELQVMMEKLEAPQTYLGLKAMIKEVDEDMDGKISFREVFPVVADFVIAIPTNKACFILYTDEAFALLPVPPL